MSAGRSAAGLTLTAARHVLILEPQPELTTELQMIGESLPHALEDGSNTLLDGPVADFCRGRESPLQHSVPTRFGQEGRAPRRHLHPLRASHPPLPTLAGPLPTLNPPPSHPIQAVCTASVSRGRRTCTASQSGDPERSRWRVRAQGALRPPAALAIQRRRKACTRDVGYGLSPAQL
jgi:hypothetical protein